MRTQEVDKISWLERDHLGE